MNREITIGKKIVLLLASSMTVMAGAIVSPALVEIGRAFADVRDARFLVPLLLTLPALFIGLTAPFAGLVVDRFGRKKVLISALVVYGVAGTSGLYLDTLTGLLVGRAMLGLAVAGVMTGSTTLIADYLEGAQRERFMGLQSAFMGLGGVVYVLTAGLLADLHWRASFGVYFSAFLLAPAAWMILHEPSRNTPDRGGSTRTAPTDRDNAQATPWSTIVCIYILAFFGMLLFYLIPTQLPFFLSGLLNSSATMVGVVMATATLFSASSSLMYGRVHRILGHEQITAVVFLMMGVGLLTLAQATSYLTALTSQLVFGLGFGLLMPNLTVWLARLAPHRARGRFIGGLITCVCMGQFLSPIVAGPAIREHGLGGFTGAFAMGGYLGMLIGLMALATLVVGRRKKFC